MKDNLCNSQRFFEKFTKVVPNRTAMKLHCANDTIKIKANLELHKSLDDFSVVSTLFGNLEVLVMYIADGDGIAAKVHHKLAVTQYAYHITFLSS